MRTHAHTSSHLTLGVAARRAAQRRVLRVAHGLPGRLDAHAARARAGAAARRAPGHDQGARGEEGAGTGEAVKDGIIWDASSP